MLPLLEKIWLSPLILVVLCFFLISLYVPLNRFLKNGYHFKHHLDDKVPLIPWFVFPYIFFYAPWMVIFYLSLLARPIEEVQLAFTTTLIAVSIGYFFFFFFPTYVVSPYPEGKGISLSLLRLVHAVDKQFNACPSMHVYMTVILWFLTLGRSPLIGIIMTIPAVMVIIATVLTKRHYVYDIFGGIIVGVVAYGGALLLL